MPPAEPQRLEVVTPHQDRATCCSEPKRVHLGGPRRLLAAQTLAVYRALPPKHGRRVRRESELRESRAPDLRGRGT